MCSHWFGQLKSASCKSVFSALKDLRSKHRSVVTNTYVKRIALSGSKVIQTHSKKITLGKYYQIFLYKLTQKNYKWLVNYCDE